MYVSMHGVAKTAYTITFGDSDNSSEKDCVHLDTKNFLPTRLSHRSLLELEASEENGEVRPGMGVWRSRSPEWTASRSPKLSEIDDGTDCLQNMPELNLDNLDNILANKICSTRSRSASTGNYLDSCKIPAGNLLVSDLFATTLGDNGECLTEKSTAPRRSPFSSPLISPNQSPLNSPNPNCVRNEPFAVDYLPPTWDPQSEFCFPVADIPVARIVPDNMEMWHFTNIQHIADGSNSNIFFAGLKDEQVIIKMIREEVQSDPVAVHEFDVEHGILVRVSHPSIINILGAGRNPRRFVVLEFLGGGTLGNILSSNLIKPGISQQIFHRSTFGFYNLVSKARDLASALEYMHQRIVPGATIIHRDLKPDNVGFTSDGSLKLFDFGLCTVVRARQGSCQGYQMTGTTGSLRYMAPEVALRKIYSEKVDVYSFGIMLWQMAADKVPFKGLSRDEFMVRVVAGGERPKMGMMWPSRFTSLLQACWSADSRARPSFETIIIQLEKMMKNT